MIVRVIADENISWRIKRLLHDWDVLPANEIDKKSRVNDITIWNYAKANSYHILTFDEDFLELQNLYGFPPKIIWLRIGNSSTNEIALCLTKRQQSIVDFLSNNEFGVYELYLYP